MSDGRPKSWWETVAGVMTGVAALITAIAGLIAVLHQTGRADRETSKSPGDSAVVSAPPPSAAASTKLERPARKVASMRDTPAQTTAAKAAVAAPPIDTRTESVPPAIDRPSFTVALQPPLEFVLGVTGVTGRFMLASVKRAPNTPESDVLKIKVRVAGRGTIGADTIVRPSMFVLIPDDGAPIQVEEGPVDNVQPGKTADEDMTFVIPAQLRHATFRMEYFGDKANIPLDLSPPAVPER